MKAIIGLVAGLLLLVVLGGIIVGGGWISTSNKYGTLLSNVESQWDRNRNELSTTVTMVQELLGVKKQRDAALERIIEMNMSGRYGAEGSKAMQQWITENNIQYDPTLDNRLFDIIAGRRESFQMSQNRIVDYQEQYKLMIRTMPSMFFASFLMGKTMDDPILTEHAILTNKDVDQDFKTSTMSAIKIQ